MNANNTYNNDSVFLVPSLHKTSTQDFLVSTKPLKQEHRMVLNKHTTFG